jgi:hypothetical protein
MRAPRRRGAPGGLEMPDSNGVRSPETGSDGLPLRVRLPGRPESSGMAAHDGVILSDHDLAVMGKAVALARQLGKDDLQDVAAGQHGPGPGLPAEEHRETRPPEPRRRFWPTTMRWRVIRALMLAAVLFCGGAVAVALGRGMVGGTGAANRGRPLGDAAIAAAAAARAAAAVWMARQVDPAAIVACDPLMCVVLQSHGIPSGRLLVLGNAGPIGSDVIVSTAAVREKFGSHLTSVYAPVALATFGSGSAQVAVRVVAADGAAAYMRSLRADVRARRAAGALLLRNPNLRVSPVGRREMAAGQVDARLLSDIGALATPYHIDITGFGAPAAGASSGVPLRWAELSLTPTGSGRSAATLDSVKGFLLAQQSTFRPADVITVRLAGGRTVLRVGFTAPSPLGLLEGP